MTRGTIIKKFTKGELNSIQKQLELMPSPEDGELPLLYSILPSLSAGNFKRLSSFLQS